MRAKDCQLSAGRDGNHPTSLGAACDLYIKTLAFSDFEDLVYCYESLIIEITHDAGQAPTLQSDRKLITYRRSNQRWIPYFKAKRAITSDHGEGTQIRISLFKYLCHVTDLNMLAIFVIRRHLHGFNTRYILLQITLKGHMCDHVTRTEVTVV